MYPEEQLIGFDVREMWFKSPAELWTERNPDIIFLLRDDVLKPLSTDTFVWPSVFSYFLDEPLPKPEWTGLIQDTWENLDTLENTVQYHWGSNWKPYSVIAITVLSGLFDHHDQEVWGDRTGYNTNPPTRDPAWQFLGYDISDQFLLSGLSDCGYSQEEKQLWLERFGVDLNQWHLITDHKKAFEFKKATDQRVPEHAPFFVYGLYLIRQTGER